MVEQFSLPFPVEYIGLFAVFAFAALYALKKGPAPVASLTVALPLAIFIYDLATTARFISPHIAALGESPYVLLAAYLVIVFAIHIAVRASQDVYGGSGKPVQALFAGLSFLMMTLVVWHILPFSEGLRSLPPLIAGWFDPMYFLFWVGGSLVTLYFAVTNV